MKPDFSQFSDEELRGAHDYAQSQVNNQEMMSQNMEEQYRQSAPTMFHEENNENLIKWQLDIKDELVRIEHLLRKHVPTGDGHGGVYYVEPDEESKLFNETGVNEIMNLLAWYLNKNIILSNFSEKDIQMRCRQFNNVLTDFIFNNYERFGLNNKHKIKHFPMVVMNITNTVEAAYNRALNGGERTSLRTARQVTQSEPLGGNPYMQNYPSNNKKRSIVKPWTWGG